MNLAREISANLFLADCSKKCTRLILHIDVQVIHEKKPQTLGTVEKGQENKEHIQRPSTTTFPGSQCYDYKRLLSVNELKSLSGHLEKVGSPHPLQSSDSINQGLEKTIFNSYKHSGEVQNQEIMG